ncbi:DUF6308 family protein [Streptomyces sp. NPDC059618]|uniref:DUF6308 family protein n=1 Tax=Streptomyces sp. NPDC059618 TaxID=3346887 RepID=UPI0036A028EC
MTPAATAFGDSGDGDGPSPLGQRIRALVNSERSVSDLRRYFGIGVHAGELPFTGRRFEHLAGGGDRTGIADIVTAEDLIAVQTLSVTVPAPVALDLLEGPLGGELSALLKAIPADIDMADAEASVVTDGSPAEQAWDLLRDQHGINWVIAGKLLARKRPRLLPVYDRVVRCALGRPSEFWAGLRTALHEDGRSLHRQLLQLRQTAGLPETVSALRVCDVTVWMNHRALDHACP